CRRLRRIEKGSPPQLKKPTTVASPQARSPRRCDKRSLTSDLQGTELSRPFWDRQGKIIIPPPPPGESPALNWRVTGMIFRQLFDSVSGTYTYLIASRRGGEALIIDPVLEKVDRYIQLVDELDLKLVKAVDTHLHADHLTGLGALRDRTHCV